MSVPVESLSQSALRPSFDLPSATPAGRARQAAFRIGPDQARIPTSLVSYESRGAVLIVGPAAEAMSAAAALEPRVSCTVLAPPAEDAPGSGDVATGAEAKVLRASLANITGHLGQFKVTASTAAGEVNVAQAVAPAREFFDLVLDLSPDPILKMDLPPPGYYAPGVDATALERAIAEIPEMVGEFEKPKYFNYDPNICAHGRSGLTGCTRCIDACPTQAISSLADRVAVDPYLCQGGGSCASACPTGAITYAYPLARDLLADMRLLLKAYREAGGEAPCVLFHDDEEGAEQVARVAAHIPERVFPVAVEAIGSVGMDVWLAGLSFGASEVLLLCAPTTPRAVVRELDHQLGIAHAVLEGLGYARARLQRVTPGQDADLVASLTALVAAAGTQPATFAPQQEKRTTLRLALDNLYAQAPEPVASSPLPAGSPFGEILVDKAACTLCMGCVSVCPASALGAGGESPQLNFTEWNCVQCGLCETACPEDAIQRSPRILYDPELRRQTRVLHQEPPFCCVACGKPFATRSMMARMREKLAGHWMFQDPDALRRLEMCEDCRVKDMFAQESGQTDSQKKP